MTTNSYTLRAVAIWIFLVSIGAMWMTAQTYNPGFASKTWNSIVGKPTVFTNNWSDVQQKPTVFTNSWDDVQNKPTKWTNTWGDVTDKPTIWTNNWDDVQSKPTVWTNLDVGGVTNALRNATTITLTNNANTEATINLGTPHLMLRNPNDGAGQIVVQYMFGETNVTGGLVLDFAGNFKYICQSGSQIRFYGSLEAAGTGDFYVSATGAEFNVPLTFGASGTLTLPGVTSAASIPTSDPAQVGQVWANNNVLTVSTGP